MVRLRSALHAMGTSHLLDMQAVRAALQSILKLPVAEVTEVTLEDLANLWLDASDVPTAPWSDLPTLWRHAEQSVQISLLVANRRAAVSRTASASSTSAPQSASRGLAGPAVDKAN